MPVKLAYSAGFQVHLAKPVESNDLARIIAKLAALPGPRQSREVLSSQEHSDSDDSKS